jgi:alanyl-tRNA synthetase
LRALGKELNAALSGRGGGSDAMIQGTLGATREQIEEFFKQR